MNYSNNDRFFTVSTRSDNFQFTRRAFVASGLAGLFAGRTAFAVPSGTATRDKPNLRFGAVSDVHIRANYGTPNWNADCSTWKAALEYYKQLGVDAVVAAGDLTDNGRAAQLQAFMATWNAVFPQGVCADGRKVEKLFILGNHDWWSGRAQIKANWERLTGMKYEEIWYKEVKGYKFVGASWCGGPCRGGNERHNPHIERFYAAHGAELKGDKPFFHIQHPPPRGTVYSPWAWGQDDGVSTRVLSQYPNAVAFAGHSHYPLTDDRNVWQGAFTVVATATLRGIALPYHDFGGAGYENTAGGNEKAKLLPGASSWSRHGLVVSVYDDRIVVARHDFVRNAEALGFDWVIPLKGSVKPWVPATAAKLRGAPAFKSGAMAVATEGEVKNRAGQGQPGWRLVFPEAEGSKKCRAFWFEVTARNGAKTVTRRLIAADCVRPPQSVQLRRKDLKTVEKVENVCVFTAAELGPGRPAFTVCPVSAHGVRGRPLGATQIKFPRPKVQGKL